MHHAMNIAFVALILLPLAHAQSDYDIRRMEIIFDISPDNSVRQATKFYFDSQLALPSLNYTLGDVVREVEVSDGTSQLQHSITRTGNEYNLQVFLGSPIDKLEISYASDNLVFVSNSVKNFFTELSLDKPVENMSVVVKLPMGYGIYQNSYIPDFRTGSDGERITLEWSGSAASHVLFSVKFVRLQQDVTLLVAAMFIFLIAVVYLHFQKKAKEEFMKGFTQDEKTTITFLSEKGMGLQKELQAQFKFSRAKATRIVSKLEEKGLVRKQKYGRTNKLYWLKK